MAPEPENTTTITDVAVMRALAHPKRIALITHLASAGAATATECAGVVGLTPSATSYHLRALAKVGMVEEAPGRGDGRERFWRSTVGSYQVEDDPDADPDVREAQQELLETFLVSEEAQVRQYLARVDEEPEKWRKAALFNSSVLLVTVTELDSLNKAILELIGPYRKRVREDRPPGARTVYSLVRTYPMDSPLPDEDMK
jgi:DNA-binding transcriptional ArsR family regulator